MRRLQDFQTKHPEVIVITLSMAEDDASTTALITKRKLEGLRVARGKDWQSRFGLTDALPTTLVLQDGRVRVVHETVLPDAVAYLEADIAAINGGTGGPEKVE